MGFFWFFFSLAPLIFAGIEECYRPVPKTALCKTPQKIDYAYVINLPERIDRWISCLSEMQRYDIVPQHFNGIYGWDLTAEELAQIGVPLQSWMWNTKAPLIHFPLEKKGHPVWVKFDETSYGKAVFYGWQTKGTIGRTLSHLSILKDAFDADYETIWVMEDEVAFVNDPHRLSALIEELDSTVGPTGWDVLYTDLAYWAIEPTYELIRQISHIIRLDAALYYPTALSNPTAFCTNHRDIGPHFMQIAGREGTGSIIYRRSGIEKILQFYRNYHLFTAYSSELALVPNLRLFALKEGITSLNNTASDADEHRVPSGKPKIICPWDRGDPWPL